MTKTFERPEPASDHCRHYSYDRSGPLPLDGGPKCARGVDLSAPGASRPCMPGAKEQVCCDLREEHTPDEHAAWKAWRVERIERMAQIMPLIPGNSTDRKNKPEWGKSGEFDCPCCDGGTVRWARARVNGHVHAACTTPNCFGVMQ